MDSREFGIEEIGVYLPDERINNFGRAANFEYDINSLEKKIGITSTAKKPANMMTSDMCVEAVKNLDERLNNNLDLEKIDLVVVVTQHPDNYGLPHVSSIVHSKLGLPVNCFAFDISLGCSGYVSALATIKGHLNVMGGKRALLLTADPYSESISEKDKNTSMIFGDGATATLISDAPKWVIGDFDFGTKGSDALARDDQGVLRMDGRTVFNFCALHIPGSIERILEAHSIEKQHVDFWALHPGSKYIVDTLSKRLKINTLDELPCKEYGNTVSSSIPFMLSDLDFNQTKIIVASGFGVGLGWATTILYRES